MVGPEHRMPARATRREQRDRRHRSRVLLLVAVCGASVVGLGAGLQSAVAESASGSAGPKTRLLADQELTASTIADRFDAAIVDVTTELRGGQGAGSGIVLTANGEIVTNYHVVEGASSITVTISDDSESYAASVVGADPADDIALLQARGAEHLSTVELGDSSALAVGDRVVAIGNAQNEPGDPAVTEGRVSALGRSVTVHDDFGGAEELTNLIATGAHLEPGNSGGPLFDAAGEVVGINTAAAAGRVATRSTSAGYAIPTNDAMRVVRQIESGTSTEEVRVGPRAFLGVTIRSAERRFGPGATGALVTGVEDGGPAERAGIVAGDRIVAIGGTDVATTSELTDVLAARRAGDTATITWVDGSGREQDARVRLERAPIA